LTTQNNEAEVLSLATPLNVNTPNNVGIVPVMVAARFGFLDLTKLLISKLSAKVSPIDAIDGTTPLLWRFFQHNLDLDESFIL
jgi:hypothetical protein